MSCGDDELDGPCLDEEIARLKEKLQVAESDVMTLCLRLHSEDPDTFALETRAVMNRWKPRVDALLAGGGE